MHKSCDLTYGLPVTVILLPVGHCRVPGRTKDQMTLGGCSIAPCKLPSLCPGGSSAPSGRHFLPQAELRAWYGSAGATAQPCLAPSSERGSSGSPVYCFLGSLAQDTVGCGAPSHVAGDVCQGAGPLRPGVTWFGEPHVPAPSHCLLEGSRPCCDLAAAGRVGVTPLLVMATLSCNWSLPQNRELASVGTALLSAGLPAGVAVPTQSLWRIWK